MILSSGMLHYVAALTDLNGSKEHNVAIFKDWEVPDELQYCCHNMEKIYTK